MPDSSTNVVYYGSNNDLAQPNAADRHSHNQVAIGRFLADPEQRRPVEFSTFQPAAEVEAAAEARMAAKLHALEQQLRTNSKPKND